jgi:hypothetical protein
MYGFTAMGSERGQALARGEPVDGPLGGLCADLRRLLAAAKLTQAEMLRRMPPEVKVGKSQLSDLLNGHIQNMPDWELVRTIVTICRKTGMSAVAQESEPLWKQRFHNVETAHQALQQNAPRQRSRLPRVLDLDRASLRAYRFPPVARDDLLDAALRLRDRHAQGAGFRIALALVGDGGVGKSVLLGQLLQRLEAAPGAVVLISCAQVSQEALGRGPAESDRALGEAARPLADMGIIEILARLRDRHGAVTLLVDTLDLILDRGSLPGLSAVLAEALNLGDVVMACRDQEYLTYLQGIPRSAPRLTGRLTRFGIPALSAEETVNWARNYLAAKNTELTASDAAFLGVLEGRMTAPGPLRQVCALPVRLAMACDVYAGEGYIPEDLTATRLFAAYWDARVRTTGGIENLVKERAALALAGQMMTADGTLILRVPRTLDADLDQGLSLLVSEGVVRSMNDGWEFFHQSFAEYAHGRWLLGQGLDGAGVTSLAQALGSDRTNLWPLAKSLLSQIEGYDDYRKLAARLPIRTPEGAQAHVVAAMGRSEDTALTEVLEQIKTSPDCMKAILPVLGEAPGRHVGSAQAILVEALRDHPAELGPPAIQALASLLPRVAPGDLATRLKESIQATISARRHLNQQIWENLPARLLAALADVHLPGETLTVICEFYPRLSPLARREAIIAHLRHPLSPGQTADLARRTLAVQCPPLNDEDAVCLMSLLWRCSEVRAGQGWSSWRDVLTALLPRTWDNAQVKFVAHLAALDVTTCTEIVNDILEDGDVDLTRHVNVLGLLTEHHADWIAMHVVTQPAPGRAGIGSLASAIKGITARAELRMRLLDWLIPGRESAPKNVWPAQIMLAGDSVQAHLRILDDLAAADVAQSVLDSMLRAWVHNTPVPVLAVLAERLRPLLTEGDSRLTQTRARLEGKLAHRDLQARQWLASALLHGASPATAGTAAKTLQSEAVGYRNELTPWLITLLGSPHTDAVMRVAKILSDPAQVSNEALAVVADPLPGITIHRMRNAVQQDEDPNLIRSLLSLIIRADKLAPLTRARVHEVYSATRARLPQEPHGRSARYSAALRDISTLCRTLLPGRFTRPEIRALLSELLSVIDPASLGQKITDALATLLAGVGRNDPGALDWLEELFGRPDIAPTTKHAIAQAVLNLDGAERGGRASRLRAAPGCPPEVDTFILNALQAAL